MQMLSMYCKNLSDDLKIFAFAEQSLKKLSANLACPILFLPLAQVV
jgi:hypothetical protein